MKVSELVARLQTFPQDAEVEASVRLILDDLARPMSAAERARAYRLRKRDTVTTERDVRDVGGKGGICAEIENQAEKKEETGSTCQVDLGETVTKTVTRHVTQRDGQVVQVFEFWREETSHARAVLDRKRAARIESRLREGFTPERLCAAIANRRNDPFLMGSNDTGRIFDGIETLLRDAAQVERLEKLTAPLTGKSVGFKSAGTLQLERAARMATEERKALG